MFSKSNLISILVTAIWAFFGGFLLWGILADSYLSNHMGSANITMMEVPDYTHLIIGCVVLAIAFSTIYSKWSNNSHSILQGVEFGFWIGILIGFGIVLIDFSTVGVLDIKGSLVNGLIYVVHFVVMGVLASIVYSKTSG